MDKITYHQSYQKFRDDNDYFISVFLSDIMDYYKSVKYRYSSIDAAELLIDKLDFYHDIYHHYYTSFVIGAILDFKYALNNYINSDQKFIVRENLDLLIQQIASRYNLNRRISPGRINDGKRWVYVTFVRDDVKLISYYDLIVKGCKVKDGYVNFLNRQYKINYPTPDRSTPSFFIIPDRHGDHCFAADTILQRIQVKGADIIKTYSGVRNSSNKGVFRYKGKRYYTLTPA
ncbi:MAG: hypothetical protein JXK07_13275 [Spirochaetes bacterium]|nr:hypothetical protein [Spirochaetota bacterium]MBN2769770.1 hypothetical protein [Spirochaetota bacterium]